VKPSETSTQDTAILSAVDRQDGKARVAEKRAPSLILAIVPLIAMGLFLGVGYGVFQFRIEVLLLSAASVAGLVGVRLGYSWKEMEDGIMDSIRRGMPAMAVVIVVGALIGSWIACGSIPMLTYYGLELLSPSWFLVTACIVCSVVSLLTGTSYGTAGTIGIAFMGIAQGMDVPLGQAAGAIVAGSYFGDKLSPFSDTTNLAPIAARSNLFDHIRHMLWTTVPAFLLGLLVYAVAGSGGGSSETPKIAMIQQVLREQFVFHWSLLLPPAIVLYLTIRKKPPIPGMLLSSAVAVLLASTVQSEGLKDSLATTVFGYTATTGLADVDNLLTRGGMQHMMEVTLIALCAFGFAGIMQRTEMLSTILSAILRFTRATGQLIAAAATASVTTAIITGSSFLSILVPGELFAPAFRQRGLAAKNLSRTTEDSGTVVVPLIPWSIAGVFMAGTLGVPTTEYAPWAVMCYSGIFFAILYGFTGIGIAPKVREDETQVGS
jgi:Na+:H+ antiporter, NhaC family